MKKNNRGITLIALVITIIVLLILSSVSILMIVGNNNLFVRTEEASYKTKMEEAADLIGVKTEEYISDYYTNTYVETVAGAPESTDAALRKAITEVDEAYSDFTITVEPASSGAVTSITISDNAGHKYEGTPSGTIVTWKEKE